MKPSFLKLYQEVNTKDGRGLLISVETPFNGLYVEYDRAKAVVWYSTEKAVYDSSGYGGKWISREYSFKDLEEWNKELKLDNTLEQLGI